MSAYEPYNRLQFLGSAVGGMLAGQPQPYMSTTSATTPQTSPLSSALSSAFGIYGLGSLFGK